MDRLKSITLEDEIELIYGKGLTKNTRVEGQFPVYGSNGIIDNHNECIFNGPSVIIGRKGTVGSIEYSFCDFWAIDTTYVLKLKSTEDSMVFWYYFLKTLNLDKMNSHSAVPGLNREAVYKIKVDIIKDEGERKVVGKVLSTLDNKIETNNQINKILEKMAQTIFNQWFVNFEFPNEHGEPYKSSGGEMVESELGKIPKGWEVKTLSEIGKIITGKTPSTKDIGNFGDLYNFITPRDVIEEVYIINSERKLSIEGANKIKNCIVGKNSIGVTCIGSNLGKVYLNTIKGFTNQQINTLELTNNSFYPYVYILLKGYKDEFINMSSGSAVPIINKTAFSSIKVTLPQEDILLKFFEITNSIFSSIEFNQIQNIRLSNLRDLLLPKLMSGEIRVPFEESEPS